MQAHELKPARGSRQNRKRIGRGNASGTGTHAGRGLGGQKSRSGRKPRRFFEGGQTRLMRRLPRRRGFVNRFRIEYQPVNLRDLERFDDGADITNDILKEAGLIDSAKKPVKILASGEITRKLNVRVERLSLTAKEKIEAAGGTAEETTERKVRSERRGAAKRKRRKNKPAEGEAAGDDKKGKGKAKAQKGGGKAEAEKGTAEGAGDDKKGEGKAKAQKGGAKVEAEKGGAETEGTGDDKKTEGKTKAQKGGGKAKAEKGGAKAEGKTDGAAAADKAEIGKDSEGHGD
ncbi:MAG: 50S ribosomal protein L15 [Chloroflexi bacterium]|nr:50S ribosomal protein L15 [Chloroflexota bacterium]MCI0783550.1 50S ribosomal protein L15 [Chloroflexota bacterium]MCI0814424.1 50S ribosomal protein L15 [Chloroflexota bacterium]MCI0831603.1 50S ribosomal protein L15 [Chloroflexota bacterium]MCI0839543.1 50S ribosomal protein L15 [Chloroflexota bacterium]